MGSRIPSHQLSGGLYVSGRPEQQSKERQPAVASRAFPYTGGDVKKSGELGKMFDISISDPAKHTRSSASGANRSGSNSGHLSKSSSSVQLLTRKSSGPMVMPPPLHPTGLITSGPLGSSGGSRSSGPLEQSGSMGKGKVAYGSAVTCLTEDVKYGFKISRVAMWVSLTVVAMGLLVGAFLMVALKKVVILVGVAAFLVPLIVVLLWNLAWRKLGLLGFLNRYPDAELRGATDGELVKITGVVTCGNMALESSYQGIPRCVYVSTELYEYRGWAGKSAKPKHCFFSWGCRHSERYVADFYISDLQSGLRAVVKAGYGAKVAPFVKPATVVDVSKDNQKLSPNFLQWLADRKLSSDDRVMRLKEGYIKEGSTVSVMGVLRRRDNLVMIVPPAEAVSTGCQWIHCLLPTYTEGLVLTCDDNQDIDVIPV